MGTKHHESLTKHQSSMWKNSKEQIKKVRLQKSKVKTVLIIFYDSDRIFHKEFHKIRRRILLGYYAGKN